MILTEKDVKDKLIKDAVKKEAKKVIVKEVKKGFWSWVKSIFTK